MNFNENKLPKRLIIDRRIWLRGEGGVDSRLLREADGKMCCVGILLRACGVPKERLKGISTMSVAIDKDTLRGRSMAAAYRVNDSMHTAEMRRETQIKELFAMIGVKVIFRN